MFRTCTGIALSALFLAALPDPVAPDPNSPRPIDAVDSVFIEDLTWMEVRDALKGGVDTAIVATGGVEQNGPYLVAGKHNYVLRGTTEAIARKLGKTLVAPIVPFVPEGDISPPTSHMKYPSTISVREETYQALLTDIISSLKTHGFRRIILIGDSGGNQAGMRDVAARLNAQWKGVPQVIFVPEYYDSAPVTAWVTGLGIKQEPEGLHDDFVMSAQLVAVDPRTVRADQRIRAGNFKINGVSLAPIGQTAAWGRRIIDYRAELTIRAIQKRSQQ
ncbi:MAG TPA: creatininase family protein [Pirellulaceae bacterium]|nr:creatininase family protein [Pirellulaceae bacterium]